MNILMSGAEQKPWAFPDDVTVTKGPLRTGDYSVAGLKDCLCIERKSLSDLVKTVIQDWIRFTKALNRMAGFDVAVIAVEANTDDLYAHKYMGDASPESVMGKCHAIMVDYGVPVVWWGSRENAQRTAYHFLKMAASKLQNRLS